MERLLLQHPEFKGTKPSAQLEYYNSLLDKHGNVPDTNMAFVKTFWQGGEGYDLPKELREEVTFWKRFYNERAFNRTLESKMSIHDDETRNSNPDAVESAEEIVSKYCDRMNLPKDKDTVAYFLE